LVRFSSVDWFKVWNPSFLLNLIKILSPFAFAKDASAAFCSMIDPIREPTESLMVPWCNNNSNNNNNVAATKAPLGAGTRSRRSQGDAFLGCRFISIHCNILIILSTAPACTPNHADHDLIVTSRRLQIWCQEVWGWQQLHQRTRDSLSFRLWFCLRQVLWQSVKGFTEKSKSILARQVVIRCCSMLFAVPPPWLAIEAKYLMYRNVIIGYNRYPGSDPIYPIHSLTFQYISLRTLQRASFSVPHLCATSAYLRYAKVNFFSGLTQSWPQLSRECKGLLRDAESLKQT
jgi:hypothetical protein